jgi:hypothetical protein
MPSVLGLERRRALVLDKETSLAELLLFGGFQVSGQGTGCPVWPVESLRRLICWNPFGKLNRSIARV